MAIFLIIVIVLLLIFIPNIFVCGISNIHSLIYYGIKDIIDYFKYKKSRLVRTGEIIGFIGLFGRGKTLSAVHS